MIRIPTRDGIELAAEVSLPEEADPSGTVVFVHGFGGDRHENGFFDELEAQVTAGGFRSLRYDGRGLGDSQGNFAFSKMAPHVDDFRSVLDWVRKCYGTSERLCVIGFSLGAVVVGQALQEGEAVDGVVYLAPPEPSSESMWPRYEDMWKRLAEGEVEQKPGSTVMLGRPCLEMLRDTYLGNDAFNVDPPLLVCHGTADSRIDISYSRKLAQRVEPGRQFRYVEFDGASHSFRPSEVHWKRLAAEILGWLHARSE